MKKVFRKITVYVMHDINNNLYYIGKSKNAENIKNSFKAAINRMNRTIGFVKYDFDSFVELKHFRNDDIKSNAKYYDFLNDLLIRISYTDGRIINRQKMFFK